MGPATTRSTVPGRSPYSSMRPMLRLRSRREPATMSRAPRSERPIGVSAGLDEWDHPEGRVGQATELDPVRRTGVERGTPVATEVEAVQRRAARDYLGDIADAPL